MTEGAEGAPATSGIEADVVGTVPKTMQAKARRLMEHLKRDIFWTARGELIHEGVPVIESNVVDLVNDMLRKRKTDPTGWQPFSRQLRAMNLPMELTLPGETTYVRRRRRHPLQVVVVEWWLLLALVVLVAHEDRSVGLTSLVDAVRWNIPCSPHIQNVNVNARSTGHVPFRHRCDILR